MTAILFSELRIDLIKIPASLLNMTSATSFIQPAVVPLHGTNARLSKSTSRRTPFKLATKATLSPTQEKALTAISLPSLPIIAYSEYVLGTTGCGLPPGPSGVLGAAEGISYLILAGLVSYSVFTKLKTGKGLPPGPFGLLGAAEGVAYLLALVGLLDAAYVVYAYGGLPTALPTEGSRCFVP